MLTPDDEGFLDLERDGADETIRRVLRVAAQLTDEDLDSLIPWVIDHFNPEYYPWTEHLLGDLIALRQMREEFAAEISKL